MEVSGIPNQQKDKLHMFQGCVSNFRILVYQSTLGREESPPDFLQESDRGT